MTTVDETGTPACRRLAVAVLLLAGVGVGCRSVVETTPPLPTWEVERAEIIRWQADDPAFDQNHALEASGLAAAGGRLYVAAEKYSRLLVMDAASDPEARVVQLALPPHVELEGVALSNRELLLCDEAHAAVYQVSLASVREAAVDDGTGAGGRRLPARELKLRGVTVRGGKIGFEGIEVDPRTGDVLLLLERSSAPGGGCVSTLFRLRRLDDSLVLRGRPVNIELEDCAWRLTGLAWWGSTLVGLRSQFPGERYEVVTIDQLTGDATVVLDLTETLRSLRLEGWGNNVEGIAFADDGALWLVSDNAVTGVIDDPQPAPAQELTLLVRIPPAD